MNQQQSDQRLLYLQRMGIEVWQLRKAIDSPVAVPETAAGSARGWEALAADVSICRLCPSGSVRTQTVLGAGNRSSQLLVVGLAPSDAEDREGEPFVGADGQLLERMLQAIGWPRERAYITHLMKCRPPERSPQALEVAPCAPYLQHQLNLVQPALILALGETVGRHLLGTDGPLADLRGRVHQYGEMRIPLVVTHDPGYLLQSPSEKAKAWQDLKMVRVTLERG